MDAPFVTYVRDKPVLDPFTVGRLVAQLTEQETDELELYAVHRGATTELEFLERASEWLIARFALDCEQ